MSMWRPYHKVSGRKQNKLLTDAERKRWETNPISRGKFRFEKEERAEAPKITIPEPVEAKKVPPLITVEDKPTEPKIKIEAEKKNTVQAGSGRHKKTK